MRILYLSDIHGNFNLMAYYVEKFNIKDAYIIQVGDFGVGFKHITKERKELKIYNDKLAKHNVIVYAIRGNHDNPKYFENDPFNLSNIKLIKDYTVLNLANKNILCIGGAISIDRKQRMTKHQNIGRFDVVTGNEAWWPNEKFNYDESKLINLRNIDILVTHTAPDYCIPNNSYGFGPLVNSFIANDPDLKIEIME